MTRDELQEFHLTRLRNDVQGYKKLAKERRQECNTLQARVSELEAGTAKFESGDEVTVLIDELASGATGTITNVQRWGSKWLYWIRPDNELCVAQDMIEKLHEEDEDEEYRYED